MACDMDVHPRIRRPSRPLIWLAAYMMPWIIMPMAKTNGNTSDVSMYLMKEELEQC
jgi:hypothetical protein